MLSLIIVIGIAFLLQGFFSFLQMRRLTNASSKCAAKVRWPSEGSREVFMPEPS